MSDGGSDGRHEPWRRFEDKVDPERSLAPSERARRAKISYRAFMRTIARKGAKTRAVKKARKDAALRRCLAAPPNEKRIAEFQREMDELFEAKVIWAAAQRGELGIADLRRRQLERREDCLLCHRPFTDADRKTGIAALGPRRRGPRLTSLQETGASPMTRRPIGAPGASTPRSRPRTSA
ncbi:MAG: hypothetical protein U0667_09455 [Chloroflexota bacterium]